MAIIGAVTSVRSVRLPSGAGRTLREGAGGATTPTREVAVMRRTKTWTCALFAALTMAFASALEVPTDADLLVTDADSRIVGVGHVVGGLRFELVVEEGFAGPASLVWLLPDGGVRTVAVVVADGAVWVDDVDLMTLLPDTFTHATVHTARVLGDAWPPGAGQGPPADVPGPANGRGPPEEPPRGPPEEPPGGPPEQPPGGPPDEPPGGPPDEPPRGPPEDAPRGRR
jgi:hypothetical protein